MGLDNVLWVDTKMREIHYFCVNGMVCIFHRDGTMHTYMPTKASRERLASLAYRMSYWKNVHIYPYLTGWSIVEVKYE